MNGLERVSRLRQLLLVELADKLMQVPA